MVKKCRHEPPRDEEFEWNRIYRPGQTWVYDCPAWSVEKKAARGEAPDLSEFTRKQLSRLASMWVRLAGVAAGVSAPQLEPLLGGAKSNCKGETPSRICPLVMVRKGLIFVNVPPKSRLFTQPLFGCLDEEQGSSMHRLQIVLRMLHAMPKLAKLPDFDFRICVDDFCHGIFEGRPQLPWFTMVSCLSNPSLPAVQWNTLVGYAGLSRDPDMAVWDQVLDWRRRARERQLSRWGCRESQAVWRGALSEHYVTNLAWSINGTLKRVRISTAHWKQQGRLALVHAACQHPDELNLFMTGIQGNIASEVESDEFTDCSKTLDREAKAMSLLDQTSAFKYVAHVEGSGGWADRLKHLLLSGAAVLKQQMGVVEWFEPLLEPYVHYIPVSSTLSNLTHAVVWARKHEEEARRIAQNAGELMEDLVSADAMHYYQAMLFEQYALKYNASQPDRPSKHYWPLLQVFEGVPNVVSTAQFSCELAPPKERKGGSGGAGSAQLQAIECAWVDLRSGKRKRRMSEIAEMNLPRNKQGREDLGEEGFVPGGAC